MTGLILSAVGLLIVLFPLFLVFNDSESMPTALWKDTRATVFGAGEEASGVKAHQVVCNSERYGTSSRGSTEWKCRVYLSGADTSVVERTAGWDASGEAPVVLRRMSGKTGDFAVSWGVGELAARWVRTVGVFVLIGYPFAFLVFWAVRVLWRVVRTGKRGF